uniref:DNA2/NAM7 helicase-like C-terminal domain-containing protein n=1 Tax=Chromera velia CCMP2878 TaxID=1169474 RepID=A0A0K6S737_9ALVE|eukprot:Cvel_18071.t1-p1 / transcript=Cvel_18071.t1 / gene=Cvel_18071 / organism=Chromera_velia_CCMP2878 / gene_product=hypothetical protein / transcript_product=hypothetical protein / location=Cvel_scaffold1478:7060-9306(+) / protein_length=749 / sequence_SO=supercontig / SO=protein_coding / is_pseudo=false
MSLSSVSRGLPSFLFDSGVRGRKGNEREKEGRGDTSLQSQQQQPDSQNPKLRSLNRCPTASTPARLTSHGEGNRGATGQAVSASASVSPLTTVCRGRSGRTVSSSGAFSSAEAKMMQSRQEQQSLGFLADTRRLNVAVTRARDALWVVGSSPVLVSHRAFKKLIAYAKYVGGFVDVASWAASGPQRGPGPRDSAALSEKAQVASFWRSANIRLKEWEKSPEVQQQQQQEKEERELVNKKPREGSSVRERAGEDGRENKRPSAAVGSQKDLQEGVRVDLKRKRKIPEGGETERFEGTLPPEREHRKEKAPLFVQGQGKGEGKGNGKEALESVGQKRPFPFSSVDPPAAGGTLPPRDIREGQVDRAQRDRHEGGLGSPGGKQNHAVGSLALERERKKVKLLPSSDISQSDLQASSSSSSSSLPRMGERGVSAAGGGAVMPARPNAERRRTKLVPPRVPNVGGPLSLRGIPPPPLSGASVPATSSRLVSSRRGAEGVRETTSEGLSAEIRPSAHSHHPHAPAPAVQMQGAQTKKRGRDADPRARPTATAAIAAAAAVDFSSFAFSSSPPSSASVFHSQSHSQSQSFPQSLPAPVRPRSQRDGEQIQRERGNQHPGQVAAGAAATGGEREAGRGGREERRKVKLIGASRPPSLPFPLSAQGQSRPPNHGGSVTSIPPQRRQRVTQGDPTPITQTQIQAQAHTRARAAVSHPPPVTGSSSSHSQGRPPSRAAEALSERPSQTAQPPERPFRRPS